MIQITTICRGYLTQGDRKRAVAQLKRLGFNHFVEYRDVAARFALCYGKYLEPLPVAATAAALVGLNRPVQLSLLDRIRDKGSVAVLRELGGCR